MFVVDSFPLAIVLCFITMLCWGSWANTQKAAGNWRFELFYWDYVFGVMILSLISAFTLGSCGDSGRGFVEDIRQADPNLILSAIAGGELFNVGNILLVAAIAIAGMAVAFPVGIGLALIVGVGVTYWLEPKGNVWLLAGGVALVAAAIVINAVAYRRLPGQSKSTSTKGLTLSVVCGLLMGCFYPLVSRTIFKDPVHPAVGEMSQYSAVFFFALGVLLSNFIINPVVMARPFIGEPVKCSDYRAGTVWQHSLGIIGGLIWCVGMSLNVIAGKTAGFAIAYGLGQGATLVAACWGVFIWREFREAPKGTGKLLTLMFICYLAGLGVIIVASNF